MKHLLSRRHALLTNAVLTMLLVAALKMVLHRLGWEIVPLNPLFSGIVAADIFLMGFLLSGVLSDYKESERLPGELAASIETIADEAATLYTAKQAAAGVRLLDHLQGLAQSIHDWFHKRQNTQRVMAQLSEMSRHCVALESLTQATFIARLKQEQSNIRRVLIRIHTIRETSFIPSGYFLAEATTVLVAIGLLLLKIDPFYESLFFVGVVTFLLRFLVLLIRDLDNPFGFYEDGSVEDVSLKPLADVQSRLCEMRDGTMSAAPPSDAAQCLTATP